MREQGIFSDQAGKLALAGGDSCQSESAGDRADLGQCEGQILFDLLQFDPGLQLAMPGHARHHIMTGREFAASAAGAAPLGHAPDLGDTVALFWHLPPAEMLVMRGHGGE